MFGYTAKEVIGTLLDTVLSLETGSDVGGISDLDATISPTRPRRDVSRHKDGSLLDVEIVAVAIREASGAVSGNVVVIRDVSEQRRADKMLAEMDELLQVANRRLARLSETKNDFVSTISHEFRTPLTSIQGFSELLETEDLTLEEARSFVRSINQNAARLARLIGDVLDLDALETGHKEIRTDRLSMNELVTRVLAEMSSTTTTHHIATQLDPALPAIRGDADLLSRVVTNLVINAVRYSPTGSRITITTGPRHGDVELTVADEGLGVPAQHRETIFSRFGRIARPEQTGIEGPGLGLPIARHILEVHNGRIWVDPNAPSGSIFHVVIPAAEPSAKS